MACVDRGVEMRLVGEPGTLLAAARNPDHSAALELRDLAGDGSGRACGTAHQDRLARFGLSDFEESKIRGQARERERQQECGVEVPRPLGWRNEVFPSGSKMKYSCQPHR